MKQFLPWIAGVMLCLPVFSQPTAKQPSTPARPRLILVVVVDQMRFDYLTRFEPLFKGGFAQLLREGATFTNAKYRHVVTETAVGHSVILSGRHPSHSGVVANWWYDSYLKQRVDAVVDPLFPSVGSKGKTVSPLNVIGFSLADVLKSRMPESKIVAISYKDRAAVLMAGKRADAAYWYNPDDGKFVTSSYYMRKLPSWVEKWNRRPFPDSFADASWQRLLSAVQLYEQYAGPDDIPGESESMGRRFPHRPAVTPPAPGFYQHFDAFPHSDEKGKSGDMPAAPVRTVVDRADRIADYARTVERRVYHFIHPEHHTVGLGELRQPGLLGSLKILQKMDSDYAKALAKAN